MKMDDIELCRNGSEVGYIKINVGLLEISVELRIKGFFRVCKVAFL